MKFLVVDDHSLIREAMRGVLKELCAEAVVLEAASAGQAAEAIGRNPDLALILLDLQLPDRDGAELLRELRESHPAVSIVMLSAFSDRDTVVRALDNGALGFIPKTESREVLLGALRLILAGGTYIPPGVLGRGPGAAAGPMQPPAPGAALGSTPLGSTLAGPTLAAGRPAPEKRLSPAELGLTERQVEVLALMMQGKSNKHICRELDLAEPTVKNHVSAILKALEVSNRTEAVLAVAALGWELRPPRR
jgi:DNA-binding NarL/FixJ family response regulator